MAWPENPGAFAVLLNAAGLSWTLSSDIAAYDAINYGVWYDDVQFARVALLHAQAAKKLKVKKIVMGECGHAHKALTVIADKILTGDLNIPRESAFTVLHEIVKSGRIQFDKSRNDFQGRPHPPEGEKKAPPTPRALPGGADGQGSPQIRLRPVQQLQGPDTRHHQVLRRVGEGGDPLRRARGGGGERHGPW